MPSKRCKTCRDEKPLDEFSPHKGYRDGLRPHCKDCYNERQRKLYDGDKIKKRATRNARRPPRRIPDAELKIRRKGEGLTGQQYSAYKRNYHLVVAYGITQADYEEMYIAQDGKCATCLVPQEKHSDLHVDHDHETGIIRGLLCKLCNTTLGKVKDNPETLLRMVDYLLKHQDLIGDLEKPLTNTPSSPLFS